MLQPDDVINEFSKALEEGRCAVFVGTGISSASGVPGWADMLRGMADTQLGIQLKIDDDPTLIAQHIGNCRNNLAPLIAHFRDMLQKTYEASIHPSETEQVSGAACYPSKALSREAALCA